MRRYSLSAHRLLLAIAATFVASLGVATTAQAVVVNDGGSDYGVALVPGTTLPGPVTPVSTPNTCDDPSLAPDLKWTTLGAVSPLCYHGGSVIHQNETYVLTWDPDRRYWATTRQFVQQFLSDVATSSGGFGSPFAVTPQYTDGSGRAQNKSVFAGGCTDFGNNTGDPSQNVYTCQFGANRPSGTGNNYPPNGCPKSGNNVWGANPNGPLNTGASNDVCLTDAQIQTELVNMLPQMGLPGGNLPGYTPLVDVLTPPGVEVCLDSSGHACSANSATNANEALFCSYHNVIDLNGTEIPYVVQPWTAQWGKGVGCDEPDAANITLPVDVTQLARQVGAKLVSPLAEGELAAITDPGMNGWFGSGPTNGAEISDNGCGPLTNSLDNVTLGGDPYVIQREFNNAGAIETDPNALPCTDWVNLQPEFVVPGPVEPGDNILLDGSVTASTLMIHNGDYKWNFGDGTTGTGPSVYHTYASGGNYQVTLQVTDRGGNTATITQTVPVLGSNGQPVPSTPPSGGNGSSPGSLTAHLQLLPQSLKSVLRYGIGVRVTSSLPANGIATVWIARAAAKRAHINVGKAANVRIGIGTVSSIKNGTVTLRLHLSKAMAKKLAHLRHVTMTVRLALVASGSHRLTADAAGRY
ncbi:MAG TPA: PKD domain-containing protein [Solirubrobacteraceae bacterium]|nr:PKD domain-containing protein [Solirubrobacteraceae bacterium]